MAQNPSTSVAAPAATEKVHGRPERLMKVGRVTSDKMDKTIVVAVDYARRHPLYNKVQRRTSKFKAHDENNEARVGDTVRIAETRPLSRSKRWRVVEIVEKAK